MGQPEKRFKVGACSASVFANEVKTKDGAAVVKNVRVQRSYKDKEGGFQSATSFGVNDIPKIVLALNKAYEYLTIDGEHLAEK